MKICLCVRRMLGFHVRHANTWGLSLMKSGPIRGLFSEELKLLFISVAAEPLKVRDHFGRTSPSSEAPAVADDLQSWEIHGSVIARVWR